MLVVFTLGAALTAYFRLFTSSVGDMVNHWTARTAALALKTLGADIASQGILVSSDAFSFVVVTECTVAGPLLLYWGAVAAFPAPWRSRLVGMVLGAAVLVPLNTLRLVTLYYVGAAYPRYFEAAHLLVWQSLIILSALVLWLIWATRFAHASPS
ncbi:MAG: hypothetical protein HY686_06585 [Chloroflexi bacterium]|nr:hypothetical protein [Chloroflexota bacterium]